MKLRRTDLHFVVIDGEAKRFEVNGELGALKTGFSQFMRLRVDEESVLPEAFRAASIRDAMEITGANSIIGVPVGTSTSGVVFRVAKIL